MMGMYPDLRARYGTAHIRLATDLRAAVKVSRENHHYLNVVLPNSKYFAAKMLSELSKSVA
jgi:hypothetical protein